MSKRGVGVLLLLALVIAVGAIVQDYRFSVMMARERAAAGAMSYAVRDLRDKAELMGAVQREYVAVGQTISDSFARVSKLIEDSDAAIAKQRATARDSEAVASFGTAADWLSRFKKLDAQIRTALGQGDKSHASDLIFMDGAGLIQRLIDALGAAEARELAGMDGTIASVDRVRWGLTGVAMLFVLGVGLYFGRSVLKTGAPSTAQMIRDLPPPVKTAASATAPSASLLLPPVTRPANLSAAAELCVDLGKVMDSGEVPVLLDRAASVLDARGIVLWAVDSDGARLHPSICHGYPDKVVRKLRPLQIDGDNVTSLAFRSTQPQTLNGASATDAAAIAVPLMTGSGCVGVLAAELRHNRPSADLMPVARIIGAQFSTLIGVPENARRTAQA